MAVVVAVAAAVVTDVGKRDAFVDAVIRRAVLVLVILLFLKWSCLNFCHVSAGVGFFAAPGWGGGF